MEDKNREKLEKANRPYEISKQLHEFYRGKLEVIPKCPVRTLNDFSYWYSPGVAQPSNEISKDPEKVYTYTNKGNFTAIVSDGSRVLGLGNIGPAGALPVMEGKALIFKYLGGVDAFPLCVNTKTADELVDLVKRISPTFGAINLEDIESPKCFEVLDRLREELEIPVWHDDRQGTATIIVAGILNSLKITNRKPENAKFVLFGAGAANLATADLLMPGNVKPENIILIDSKGILHKDRKIDPKNKLKQKWANISNGENRKGGLKEALKGADFLIALSIPGPDVIPADYIKNMAKDPVVFACANPVPEIWPWDAKAGGAKIVATGRSDFENQVNNSLVFPGVFRGALEVRAKTITDEMCFEAAKAIAKRAEDIGLSENFIIPTMEDQEVVIQVACAVGKKAIELGLANNPMSEKELYNSVSKCIKRAQAQVKTFMDNGIIKKTDLGLERD
jgi:malate dehydrogenase (oxaloacetate-decarboxylating)